MYTLDDPSTTVVCENCLEWMRRSNYNFDPSVDLIFADPPFNIGQKYSGFTDRIGTMHFHDFLFACVLEFHGLLKPTGSLWVNLPDELVTVVVKHATETGFILQNWCIWHYRFGQCQPRKFIRSKTHALHFTKDQDNYKWYPEAIYEPSDRATLYNDPRTQESSTPGMRMPLDVWYGENWGRVQGNNRERWNNHPNQLPELYLARVIKSCTLPGDLVFDPFLGSGTTCVVARALGRRSIGCEISSANAESAFIRIQKGAIRV